MAKNQEHGKSSHKQRQIREGNKAKILKQKDRAILDSFNAVADTIAKAFGSHCEVVIHSLSDVSLSVTKIVNGQVTGRKEGSPLTDFGIEILKKADSLENDTVGPYFIDLDDGRKLRCVTMLIRNEKARPVGMMCINIDLSVPLVDFFKDLLQSGGDSSQKIVEHFAITPREMISRTLEKVIALVDNQRKLSSSDKNKMVVMELYKKGIFNVRGAIDLVAEETGISRYTVYNYIREAKLVEEKRTLSST